MSGPSVRIRWPIGVPRGNANTAAIGTSMTLSLAESASANAAIASSMRVPGPTTSSAASVPVAARISPIDVAASSAGKCRRERPNSAAPTNAATGTTFQRRARR